MNREIKFRAWDKVKEQLKYQEEIEDIINGFGYVWESDYLVWMQFTGLQDKEENDIYEGDIIKTSTGQIELVKWDDNKRYAAFYPFMPIFSTYLNYTEVIGNQFEDPELMEKIN